MSKIHEIDGVKYREVARKAEVGEKIVCINKCVQGGNYYHASDVGYMLYKSEEYPSIRVRWFDGFGGKYSGGECYVGNDDYRVLEQIEEPTQPSEPLLDLIAKLTTRLMRLEDELDTVRKNVQTFAEATARNEGDIRTLDARTRSLVTLEKYYEGGDRQ